MEIEGKVALTWILGQHGDQIELAPYMLEKILAESKDFSSAQLSMSILVASFKLFFKRGPETKRLLSQVFRDTIESSQDNFVKQKAVFLYRLL